MIDYSHRETIHRCGNVVEEFLTRHDAANDAPQSLVSGYLQMRAELRRMWAIESKVERDRDEANNTIKRAVDVPIVVHVHAAGSTSDDIDSSNADMILTELIPGSLTYHITKAPSLWAHLQKAVDPTADKPANADPAGTEPAHNEALPSSVTFTGGDPAIAGWRTFTNPELAATMFRVAQVFERVEREHRATADELASGQRDEAAAALRRKEAAAAQRREEEASDTAPPWRDDPEDGLGPVLSDAHRRIMAMSEQLTHCPDVGHDGDTLDDTAARRDAIDATLHAACQHLRIAKNWMDWDPGAGSPTPP